MDEKNLMIGKESLEKNKEFIKLLFEADIPGNWTKFDKLDCSVSLLRQNDPDMTLEQYLANMKAGNFVSLIVGRKEYPHLEETLTISLMVRGAELPDSPKVERFLWYFCPYNEENYTTVNELFKRMFNSDIADYK